MWSQGYISTVVIAIFTSLPTLIYARRLFFFWGQNGLSIIPYALLSAGGCYHSVKFSIRPSNSRGFLGASGRISYYSTRLQY